MSWQGSHRRLPPRGGRVRRRLIRLVAILAIGSSVLASGAAPMVSVPLGLDLYVPAPAENPITREKIALGRRLFFERRLSRDGRTACASCHEPARAFADGRRLPVGVHRRAGRRNAPSLLNRAYGTRFFWDGRAATLEDQVRIALAGERDLDLPVDEAASRLANDRAYLAAFKTAFDAPVSPEGLVQALATFVRVQLSGASAFDRFTAGDRAALSPQARQGFDLFNGKARCGRCHAGPLFSDEEFHNTGVSWGQDLGRFEVTRHPDDRGRFKTPSLRNVAVTAPYMHDGSLATLDVVIDFYDRGAGANPNLDDQIRPLALSREERLALASFLRALTGSAYVRVGTSPRD
jgi:cytochrome c peroxidase